MARFKYFFDAPGGTIEVRNPFPMELKKAQEKFPSIKLLEAKDYMHGFAWMGYVDNDLTPVSRKIKWKTNPSFHECDARCLNASGRTMQCECSCGGKNHGKGMMMMEEGGI